MTTRSDDILTDIADERARQAAKTGDRYLEGRLFMHTALAAQFGNVSTAVLTESEKRSAGIRTDGARLVVRCELIELAAAVVEMVECLDQEEEGL
jgi:hypothetical protein